MPENSKFYLTTPIYYVNARPHIGHAYSTIAADVLARRHRLLGEDVFFLTGTDEHGQKVQRSAEAAGIPPQQFADEVSATFRSLWDRMGITYSDYIRTTDDRHKRGVQHLWKVLEQKGAIYLSSYTGQYCVSDEAFVDVPVGAPCPTCGRITETITEENYFFKLSEYQEKLINLIESGELHIQPETAKNEVLSFVRGNVNEITALASEYARDFEGDVGKQSEQELLDFAVDRGELALSNARTPYVPGALKDLSISRTTFDWGIKVPGNHNHVVYVWLDALANYITAIGYGAEDRDDLTTEQKQAELAKFAKYWPADVHLVGKEITRFHCVYWPAFLMAADIPTPKSVVANGWLLFEESKMSKSRGNVVRTETILDAFGPLCPAGPLSLDSTGLQPGESAAKNEGALAPGLAPPNKAQQDLFAADVIRYFLLREIPFGQDGSFSFDALITRYNAELANGYGNLVSRVLKMVKDYCDGAVPASRYAISAELLSVRDFADGIDRIGGNYEQALRFQHSFFASQKGCNFSDSLELIQQLIARVDGFLTEMRPWKLDPSDPVQKRKRDDVLYASMDAIKLITFSLHEYLPTATAKVWTQLGFSTPIESVPHSINQPELNLVDLRNLRWGHLKPGTKLGPLAPIFPRADKGLAQIMTDMEAPATPAPATPEPAAATPAAVTSPSTNNGQPPADSSATPQAQPITIDDFVKIDLRVAQIVVAERIPKADKLLRLEVDLGYEKRQILSGIAEWYTPEELIGRRIAIIANLAPRKMRGLESHGMLLAASGEDHSSKPILASFSDEIALGSKIR